MNILYAWDKLLKVSTGKLFRKSLVLHDEIKEFTALDVFHYKVQILFSLDYFVNLYDIWMMQLLKYFYLSAYSFYIFLVFYTGLF